MRNKKGYLLIESVVSIMLIGIAITCFAAVFGMWVTAFQMVRSKRKLYFIFSLIIAIVLTLSASGLITLHG